MNWPSYGQGVLRPLLRRAILKLDPLPSTLRVLLDQGAAPHVRPLLEDVLSELTLPYVMVEWAPSEARKDLAQVEELARELVREWLDRRCLLLAVGGGVTTDVGGFVAATLLRGLRWGAIPTTLLGMADAALGGKTAVNLPEGKNLVGAFHAPEFVIADVDLLAGLPPREWRSGLGEILKAGLIGDAELLCQLEELPGAALRRPGPEILEVVSAAGRVKMRIVIADPKEEGERMLLNLGHSFAHALEAAAGYGRLAHGEAVGLGLRCAARLATRMEIAEEDLELRVRKLLARLGLPLAYDGELPGHAALTRLLIRDKKAREGRIDLVLPVRPEQCLVVRGMEPEAVAEALYDTLGPP